MDTTQQQQQQPDISSSGYIPIRAPITLSSDEDDGDDTDDFYYEPICPKIAISSSDSNNTSFHSFINRSNLSGFDESGSEGFVSGGEDFEVAQERPSVATPHEESMKVDESKCNNEFFRHFVKHPDEEILENVEKVAKDEFFRAVVAHPDEEVSHKNVTLVKARLDVDGNISLEQLFKPFVVGSGKEIAEELKGNGVKDNLSSSFAEDNDESNLDYRREKDRGSDFDEYSSAAEAVVLSAQGPNLNAMPIARLSMDSDEDEGIHFEAEDDDCVDTVRIQGFSMLQRKDAAPEIRAVGEEEKEFNESLLGVHSSIVSHTSSFVGDGNKVYEIGKKVLVGTNSMVNFVYAKVTQDDDQISVENSPEEYCEVEGEIFYDDIEEIRSVDMPESICMKINGTDDCNTQTCSAGKDLVPGRAEIDFCGSNTALRKVVKQDAKNALEETLFPATNENGLNDTDVALDKDQIVGMAKYGSDLREAYRFLKMDDETQSSSNIPSTDSNSDPRSKGEEGGKGDEFDYNLVKARVDEKSLPSKKEAGTLTIGPSETDKQVMVQFKGIVATSESVDCKFELPPSELTVSQMNDDAYKEGKEIVDSNSCTSTITSLENFEVLSFEQHAGSDSPFVSSEPALPSYPITSMTLEDTGHIKYGDNFDGREKEKLVKIQLLRFKFLRLIQRLGYSHEYVICKKVLYHLATALEGYCTQACNLESEKKIAMQLEADGGKIDFSLNILVLGKTGVGKSRTINSIFGESKTAVNAFEPATSTVKEIIGAINGIRIRILDTPGFRISGMEQAANKKISASIKKFAKRYPPDVVLYVDRLDSQSKDSNDLALLHSITSSLGSSIWKNAILTLTHAASAPPDGPNGSPLDYEAFVTQRYHLIQHCITRASCDFHLMNPYYMCPLSLIENLSDGKNELNPGLLDVQNWRSHLLLLCYSLKIFSEARGISGTENSCQLWKPYETRTRCSPPEPYLPSLSLQSCANWKDFLFVQSDTESTVGWEDELDCHQEYKYRQLPLFKPLMTSDIAKISKDQRKESRWWKWMQVEKNGGARAADETAANTSFPLPDIYLHPSIDGDDLICRYQCMETASGILTRPVLDAYNGWAHDCGYEIERNLSTGSWLPSEFAVQITMNKLSIKNLSLVSIGRNSKLAFDVGLNNKHNGKIIVRTSSSEHPHMALLGILPLAISMFRTLFTQF